MNRDAWVTHLKRLVGDKLEVFAQGKGQSKHLELRVTKTKTGKILTTEYSPVPNGWLRFKNE